MTEGFFDDIERCSSTKVQRLVQAFVEDGGLHNVLHNLA